MSEKVRCRSCGQETEGGHFCENCGEYLSWTPTGMGVVVPTPTEIDTKGANGADTPPAPGPAAPQFTAAALDVEEALAALAKDPPAREAPPAAEEPSAGTDVEEAPPPAAEPAAAEAEAAAQQPPGTAAPDGAPAAVAAPDDGGAPAAAPSGDAAAAAAVPGDVAAPVAGAEPEPPSAGGDEAVTAPVPPPPAAPKAKPPLGGMFGRRGKRKPDPAPAAGASAVAAGRPGPGAADSPSVAAAAPAAAAAAAAAAPQAPAAAQPAAPSAPPAAAAAAEMPAPPPPPPSAPAAVADPPPPPPRPPAATAPEVPTETGDASLVVDAVELAIGASGVPAVDPGSTLTYVAMIRNESQIVDNYDIAVVGLPQQWAIVSPATVYLVPLGSDQGESDAELRIDITPTRDYRSTAGIWEFELLALSRTNRTIAARVTRQFEVRPFQSWVVDVVPRVNTGRLRARYRTAVRNDGNSPQVLWPVVLDETGKLRSRFNRRKLTLGPGEIGLDVLTLKPRIPRVLGRPSEHHVGVDVSPTEPDAVEAELGAKDKAAQKAREEALKAGKGVKVGPKGVTLPRLPKPRNPLSKLKLDASALARLRTPTDTPVPASSKPIVFRQKAIIPLWLIGVIVAAAIIGALAYLLWPRTTTVPVLVGTAREFDAEKKLREEGLVLARPVQRRVAPNSTPGMVIDQSPSANAKVDEGSSVSIVVAAGELKVDVPPLKGLTLTAADELLRDSGLKLGEVQPADPPATYRVSSQVPDAGQSVERGESVRVFLKKPPKPKPKPSGSASSASSGGGGGGGGSGGSSKPATVAVPDYKDKTVSEYSESLDKAGLESAVDYEFSSEKANTVLAVSPAVGKKVNKGDTVAVSASRGLSPIAIQTQARVVAVDPVTSKQKLTLPIGAAQPSYFPDGERIVYRASGRLVSADADTGEDRRTLYSGTDDLTYPSISPTAQTIAVIRREEGDGDLCLGRATGDIQHLCLPDDGWDLEGSISWRKDGKALLVPGRLSSDRSRFGIREYRVSKINEIEPLLWSGRTVTKTGTAGKGVLAMSYSPGGSSIAAISNLESANFQVVITKSDDLGLADAEATGVGGCDVAWRPDGNELAVVQVDEGCSQSLGKLVRFKRATPKETTTVTETATNPMYRPG